MQPKEDKTNQLRTVQFFFQNRTPLDFARCCIAQTTLALSICCLGYIDFASSNSSSNNAAPAIQPSPTSQTVPGEQTESAQSESAPVTHYIWNDTTAIKHVSQSDFTGELSEETLQTLIDLGEKLFSARFTGADGVGRPMSTQAIIPTKRKRPPRNRFSRTSGLDANACASCHNQPFAGGAGDFVSNVFVSEGFQNTDFDNTDPQFSNERNTNHLFGAGLVELLAREMTADLQLLRNSALTKARDTGTPVTVKLLTKEVDFGVLVANADGTVDLRGVDGVDADLVIKPFSQKGVITSLRQFTINALNHHHGMLATELSLIHI